MRLRESRRPGGAPELYTLLCARGRIAEVTMADYCEWTPNQAVGRIKKMEDKMFAHARNLEFEEAARLRDEIPDIKEQVFGFGEGSDKRASA